MGWTFCHQQNSNDRTDKSHGFLGAIRKFSLRLATSAASCSDKQWCKFQPKAVWVKEKKKSCFHWKNSLISVIVQSMQKKKNKVPKVHWLIWHKITWLHSCTGAMCLPEGEEREFKKNLEPWRMKQRILAIAANWLRCHYFCRSASTAAFGQKQTWLVYRSELVVKKKELLLNKTKSCLMLFGSRIGVWY